MFAWNKIWPLSQIFWPSWRENRPTKKFIDRKGCHTVSVLQSLLIQLSKNHIECSIDFIQSRIAFRILIMKSKFQHQLCFCQKRRLHELRSMGSTDLRQRRQSHVKGLGYCEVCSYCTKFQCSFHHLDLGRGTLDPMSHILSARCLKGLILCFEGTNEILNTLQALFGLKSVYKYWSM